MTTQKRTPVTAATGALDVQADKNARANPGTAKTQLLDQLDVLEVLSHWKLELQAKLARKQVVFLFADSSTDFGPLSDEVRDFVRVSKLLRWARRFPL